MSPATRDALAALRRLLSLIEREAPATLPASTDAALGRAATAAVAEIARATELPR